MPKEYIGKRVKLQIGGPTDDNDDKDKIIGSDTYIRISKEELNQYNSIIGEKVELSIGDTKMSKERINNVLHEILAIIESADQDFESINIVSAEYSKNEIGNALEIAYDEGFFKGIESHDKSGKNWISMELTIKGIDKLSQFRQIKTVEVLKAAQSDEIGIAPIEESGIVKELLTISSQRHFKGKAYSLAFRDCINSGYLSNVDGKQYIITEKGLRYLKDTNPIENQNKKSDRIHKLSNKVMILHGHDKLLKTEIENILLKANLEVVVLQDKIDYGKTIIEKFIEETEDVAYAIALFCPEDTASDGTIRARQNVLFEIGYFLGKLGRSKVKIIKKEDTDIPSNLIGILYIPYDESGAWKTKLLKELKAAGLEIDSENILNII